MSNPEDETLNTMHYEMVESVVDHAQTIIQMHPGDNKEQVRKMLYLFVETMCAFVQSIPGLQKGHMAELAAHAFDLGRELSKTSTNETLN